MGKELMRETANERTLAKTGAMNFNFQISLAMTSVCVGCPAMTSVCVGCHFKPCQVIKNYHFEDNEASLKLP